MITKTGTRIAAAIVGSSAVVGLALVFATPKPADGEEWIRKKYSAAVVYDETPKTPPKSAPAQPANATLPAERQRLLELFPELDKAAAQREPLRK